MWHDANFRHVTTGTSRTLHILHNTFALFLAFLAGFITAYAGATLGLFYQDTTPSFWFLQLAIGLLLLLFFFITLWRGLTAALGSLSLFTVFLVVITIALADKDIAGLAALSPLVIGGSVAGSVGLATAITLIQSHPIPIALSTLGLVIGSSFGLLDPTPSKALWLLSLSLPTLILGSYLGHRTLQHDYRYRILELLAIHLSTWHSTNFRKSDLTKADFSHATLRHTDFSHATLTHTCWYKANFEQSNLQGTYLNNHTIRDLVTSLNGQGGTFDRLDLRGVNLDNANLVGASFKGADLTNATLKGADLTDAQLDQAQLYGANLTGATLVNAKLGQTQLYGADLTGAILVTGLNDEGKNFDRLDLRGINLDNANLVGASFIGTNLSNATLKGADLTNAKLAQTQLYGADLTGAILTRAYIENWGISPETKLDSIQCDEIYLRLPTPENSDPYRKPDNRDETFQANDFTNFIAPILNTLKAYREQTLSSITPPISAKTLDLCHREGIDSTAAAIALQELINQNPQDSIQVISVEGVEENIRIQASIAIPADPSILCSHYFLRYKQLTTNPSPNLQIIFKNLATQHTQVLALEARLAAATNSPRSYVSISPNLASHRSASQRQHDRLYDAIGEQHRHLDTLEIEFKAVHSQLAIEMDPVNRTRLKTRIQQLESDLEIGETKLHELEQKLGSIEVPQNASQS
jgi:uncharacterized protein YjbI with pentapeptide repeats